MSIVFFLSENTKIYFIIYWIY